MGIRNNAILEESSSSPFLLTEKEFHLLCQGNSSIYVNDLTTFASSSTVTRLSSFQLFVLFYSLKLDFIDPKISSLVKKNKRCH